MWLVRRPSTLWLSLNIIAHLLPKQHHSTTLHVRSVLVSKPSKTLKNKAHERK
jgi:hypothetical protein